MKEIVESFCTGCEWHGDGTGMIGCPICGEPITSLDVNADTLEDEEEYPPELVEEEKDEEEDI